MATTDTPDLSPSAFDDETVSNASSASKVPAYLQLLPQGSAEGGRIYPLLPGKNIIGREDSGACPHVPLPLKTVSIRHAYIDVDDDSGTFFVSDLGSRNRTMLSKRGKGRRRWRVLEPQKLYEVTDGQLIRFGTVELAFHTGRLLDVQTPLQHNEGSPKHILLESQFALSLDLDNLRRRSKSKASSAASSTPPLGPTREIGEEPTQMLQTEKDPPSTPPKLTPVFSPPGPETPPVIVTRGSAPSPSASPEDRLAPMLDLVADPTLQLHFTPDSPPTHKAGLPPSGEEVEIFKTLSPSSATPRKGKRADIDCSLSSSTCGPTNQASIEPTLRVNFSPMSPVKPLSSTPPASNAASEETIGGGKARTQPQKRSPSPERTAPQEPKPAPKKVKKIQVIDDDFTQVPKHDEMCDGASEENTFPPAPVPRKEPPPNLPPPVPPRLQPPPNPTKPKLKLQIIDDDFTQRSHELSDTAQESPPKRRKSAPKKASKPPAKKAKGKSSPLLDTDSSDEDPPPRRMKPSKPAAKRARVSKGQKRESTDNETVKGEPPRKRTRNGGTHDKKSVEDDEKPSQRTAPSIMLTGLILSAEQEAGVKRLGGKVVPKVTECTHLVVTEPKRTIKLLCAMSVAKHVVRVGWIDDSITFGKWIDPRPYTPKGTALEKRYQFTLREATERSVAGKVFDGMSFILTPTPLNKIGRNELANIIECGGGVVVGSSGAVQRGAIVITADDDIGYCWKNARGALHYVTTEWVFLAALRQKLPSETETERFTVCITDQRPDRGKG